MPSRGAGQSGARTDPATCMKVNCVPTTPGELCDSLKCPLHVVLRTGCKGQMQGPLCKSCSKFQDDDSRALSQGQGLSEHGVLLCMGPEVALWAQEVPLLSKYRASSDSHGS